MKLQGSTLPKHWINIHNYECCRYHHRQTHSEQRHLACKFVTLNQNLMIQETNTTLTNTQLDVCSVCWLGFVNLMQIRVIHLKRDCQLWNCLLEMGLWVCLGGIFHFLINDLCGRAFPPVSCTIPQQVAISYIKQQTEQTLSIKAVSRIPTWLLFQFLPQGSDLSSCLNFNKGLCPVSQSSPFFSKLVLISVLSQQQKPKLSQCLY